MYKSIWGRILVGGVTAALLLGLTACGNAQSGYALPDEQKLVIYTSHKEEVYRPIIKEFEERTGIWVEVHAGGTSELMEQIASGETDCDVMFGGGVESYLAYADVFEPYVCSRTADIKEDYQSKEGVYTLFTELPVVLIYNNKLVDEKEAPSSWHELFYEKWRGNIAFADPLKSGSSYTMLVTMLQVVNMDEHTTLSQFAKALNYDVAASSGDAVEQVANGEKTVGITLEETARQAIAAGGDISISYLKDGTSAVPDGCAMVKECFHPDNAKAFIEFIVSDDVQHLEMEEQYRRSVLKNMPNSNEEELQVLPYDLNWAADHRDNILSLWTQIVGGQSQTKADEEQTKADEEQTKVDKEQTVESTEQGAGR